MKLTMKNAELGDRKRTVHTRPIHVRLKSGAYRNKFFKRIDEEWKGFYRIFAIENVLKDIEEDVLNPEVKMMTREMIRKIYKIWDLMMIGMKFTFHKQYNST